MLSRYKLMMRVLGALYLAAATLVFFFANQVFYVINLVPSVIKSVEAIPESSEKFWTVQGSTLMILLAVLCFTSAQLPTRRTFPLIHFFAKIVAILEYFYLYKHDRPYFAYLLWIVMDVLIALILLWGMIRIAVQKPFTEETTKIE